MKAQFNVDRAVCLVPTRSTDHEQPADIVNGDAAFYANAAPQTDTIVRAAAAGETLIESLRGSAAPTSFSWSVGIPDGTKLQTLSDGGVAVVDSEIPAAVGSTVPPIPDEATQLSGIPKASVQLAEEQHEVAAAEQETGNAVEAVIAPPYTVDSAGNSHVGALSVGADGTITASSVAGSSALVLSVYENASRRGPPRSVEAFYTGGKTAGDLRRAVQGEVCKYRDVKRKILNVPRTLVFDMGGARKISDGVYGASTQDSDLSNKVILRALRAGASEAGVDGGCHLGKVAITYGVSNSIHMESSVAREAGQDQGHHAHRLQAFINHHPGHLGEEQAATGGDIEMHYSGPDPGTALAAGAANHFGGRYFDWGDAEDCPPVGSNGCKGGWTLHDIAGVSYGHGARPLPEIYCGSPNEAAQWANVAQAGPSAYHFAGTSAEHDGQGLSPGGGWFRLNAATQRYVGGELIEFPNPHTHVCG